MRSVSTLLVIFACLCSIAWADVPDPDYCIVLPMDEMETPRMIGIPADTPVPAADLNIFIAAFGGEPIADAYVEVVFSWLCEDLCICEEAVFIGYTDENGYVQIHGQFGGCCEAAPDAAMIVIADGVGIRAASYIVSPDWDGLEGNCTVALDDFIVFGNAFAVGSGAPCTDYSGDGVCRLEDFIIFGGSWGAGCTGD